MKRQIRREGRKLDPTAKKCVKPIAYPTDYRLPPSS